jgi:tRNA threonylcarbamoyladenosine biosynthesis protein TsaE
MIKIFNTITKNHNETENLGFKFSKQISKGDIITLNGGLGSGKTTFVKGVLKGLSYNQEVTSPTYTLINEYNALYNIIHIDCYREKKIDRWLNIGLMDYFETDGIFFIEWAENIKDLLPKKTIDLFFHILNSNDRLIKYNE